jgi:predicted DNA-binding protein
MITTSVRLPRSLLERVRTVAASQGVKTSVMIRRLIEKNLSPEEMGSSAESLNDLVRASVRAELSAWASSEPRDGELGGDGQAIGRLGASTYTRLEFVAGETFLKRPASARKAGRARSTQHVAGLPRHVLGRREAG